MIILILILAFGLRITGLNQSLWLDEAISALAARDYSYQGIIFEFLKIDNHPPAFYLLLKFWGQIFRFGDTALRFLSVLLGTVLVYFSSKIGAGFNKKAGITAGILTATAPLLVYYSQEVRMYILITLLCGISIYIFQSILKKESLGKWILFSLVLCLLFFSDYITVFFFPVFILYPLILKRFSLLKKILLSFIPLFVLFIFWYPVFSAQLIKNKELVELIPGWASVVGGATFKNLVVAWMKFVLGRISLENKLLYYGLIGIFSLPLLAGLFISARKFKEYLLIWLWLVVPVSFGFLFSFFIPVFNYFRFIYVMPAILILCALAISNLKPRFKYLLLGLILTGNILGLSIYYFDASQQRENWKQGIQFIDERSNENEIILVEFHEPFAPLRFYNGKTLAIGALDNYYADEEKTSAKIVPILENKTGVYHFEYLRDLTDPNRFLEKELERNGFSKKDIYDFINIGQVSYWEKDR